MSPGKIGCLGPGQVHVTSTVPQEKVEVYKEEYPDNLTLNPYYGTY